MKSLNLDQISWRIKHPFTVSALRSKIKVYSYVCFNLESVIMLIVNNIGDHYYCVDISSKPFHRDHSELPRVTSSGALTRKAAEK